MDITATAPEKASKAKRFGVIKRFRSDKRGSVAIEFAMLAMPFAMLVFAVLETCISFAAQQVMANATDDIARNLRTGKLKPNAVTSASMFTLVCDNISILVTAGCPELVIDLKQYPTYAAVPKTIPLLANGDLNQAGFTTTPGGPNTINSMRVFYRWPIMTDFMRAYLSSIPNGKTLLYTTMTWKNEGYPYP